MLKIVLWCHLDLFFRFVYVWDTVTRNIVYKLPGHNGSVNDVDFHPDEPIRELLKTSRLFAFEIGHEINNHNVEVRNS